MNLEIKKLSKTFKEKTVVSNFSMEIKTGECIGLIGPNGAGKTTLIKMIVDILQPDNGRVLLNEKGISSMKNEIGYLPQYPNFYQWMTAKETLLFMGGLSGISKKELETKIPAILKKVGLKNEHHSKVGTFSGGMKQRLGIAQALLHKPSFIVMDEPVSALDPIGRREVLDLLKEIKEETTILLSTHILTDAEEICERFVVMKNGLKIEDTTIGELLNRDNGSVIHLKVTPKDLQWFETIKTLPYVKSLEVIGNKAKIELTDLQNDKAALLRHSLDNHVDIIQLEVGNKDTLEEIFLKMVVGT